VVVEILVPIVISASGQSLKIGNWVIQFLEDETLVPEQSFKSL